MRAVFLALLCASAPLRADPPLIIYRPTPATVVSPLAPPTAQAGQSLLNQINDTLARRRTEHEILTTNAVLRAPPARR